MEHSNRCYSSLSGDILEKDSSFCCRESQEDTVRRGREVQGVFKKERRERKESYRWGIIAIGLVIGCVRYLPEDAAYYRGRLEDCQRKHSECESELKTCKELGVDLLRCP